jgi:predicted DNA-binding transcriptional regulator YafY
VRRADRLFRLLLEPRRGRVVTAREPARRLEVSERTVYRDVADLSASGVPIAGEAGVGYRLSGFELPPLMFDRVGAIELGGDPFADEPGKSLADYVRQVDAEIAAHRARSQSA